MRRCGSDESLAQDCPETEQLLGSDNVVPEALQRFARDAADFATHGKLGNLEFALDAHGQPDVSAFDFTSMMRAESAARVQERHGARLLLGLVGDCLVEVRGPPCRVAAGASAWKRWGRMFCWLQGEVRAATSGTPGLRGCGRHPVDAC